MFGPVKVLVAAYHKVDDFRPYVIRMKDKGDDITTLVHAFVLAIKREAGWNGWFDEYSLLEGITLSDIRNTMEGAMRDGKEDVVFVTKTRDNADKVVDSETYRFTVWFEKDGNRGFGFGHVDADGKVLTDKYNNKWITLS